METTRPRRDYHHGRTPAAWFGSMLTLLGFLLAAVGAMLGPNWALCIAGAICIVIGLVGGAALSVAGFGQEPRP